MSFNRSPSNTSNLYHPKIFNFTNKNQEKQATTSKFNYKIIDDEGKEYRVVKRPPKNVKQKKVQSMCKTLFGKSTIPKNTSILQWNKYVVFFGLTTVPSESAVDSKHKHDSNHRRHSEVSSMENRSKSSAMHAGTSRATCRSSCSNSKTIRDSSLSNFIGSPASSFLSKSSGYSQERPGSTASSKHRAHKMECQVCIASEQRPREVQCPVCSTTISVNKYVRTFMCPECASILSISSKGNERNVENSLN